MNQALNHMTLAQSLLKLCQDRAYDYNNVLQSLASTAKVLNVHPVVLTRKYLLISEYTTLDHDQIISQFEQELDSEKEGVF